MVQNEFTESLARHETSSISFCFWLACTSIRNSVYSILIVDTVDPFIGETKSKGEYSFVAGNTKQVQTPAFISGLA